MSRDMQLTSLTFYPIKSMRGQDLAKARITPRGIRNDRLMMVTNPEGKFYTQRELPRLAAITPRLQGETLSLSAMGVEALTVSLKHEGQRSAVIIWDDRAEAIDQ